jgi:transposase
MMTPFTWNYGSGVSSVVVAIQRKEVAKLKMERDILKKAAAYFAKESI